MEVEFLHKNHKRIIEDLEKSEHLFITLSNDFLIRSNFKCAKCDKIFTTRRRLITHLNKKTPCEKIIVNPTLFITSLQCPFCLKTYKTKWTLNHHITICKMRVNDIAT
ncbi:MAG: hypothetical protein KAS12_01315 [Candidatus Aenigmarchaeota archaeon]|nr:hypothetical protein [Candidatus Aenigmarchaeota archaeon]